MAPRYNDTCRCGYPESDHYRFNLAGETRCSRTGTCTGYDHSEDADRRREFLEDATEAELKPELESARKRMDDASRAHDVALEEWNKLRHAYAQASRRRVPREDELTYALGATCRACEAPLAYWPASEHRSWKCARVLLDRIEKPFGLDQRLPAAITDHVEETPAQPGVVYHDELPFFLWKVRSDPSRKAL